MSEPLPPEKLTALREFAEEAIERGYRFHEVSPHDLIALLAALDHERAIREELVQRTLAALAPQEEDR